MEISEEPLAITKLRRRWFAPFLCAAGIVAILAVCALTWRQYSAKQHQEDVLAELDRTDPGWRLEDIEAAREQIPEDENSAGVILAAAQMLPRVWPPEDLSEEHFRSQPTNELLSGEEFVHLEIVLTRMKSAVDIAAKLTDMPRGRYRLPNSRSSVFPAYPADQLNSQRIGTLLIFESLLWNQRGESKSALLACRAAVNAARSLGDEPSRLSQFVRRSGIEHACRAIERTLGQGEPPPEDLAIVQKLLENEDNFPSLLIATRGERALGHRVFEALEQGEISLDDLTARWRGRLERTVSQLRYMDTREDHALFLSLMTRRVEEVQKPLLEQVTQDQQFMQLVRGLPKNDLITQALLPALSTVGETFRRKQAYLRCTIVALALERFRSENRAWPESLRELCPGYLAAELLDPLDGKPLRYRRTEDGVIIYSIGPDAVENNANIAREHPDQPGVDIGFRLWNVDKRRQPPHP